MSGWARRNSLIHPDRIAIWQFQFATRAIHSLPPWISCMRVMYLQRGPHKSLYKDDRMRNLSPLKGQQITIILLDSPCKNWDHTSIVGYVNYQKYFLTNSWKCYQSVSWALKLNSLWQEDRASSDLIGSWVKNKLRIHLNLINKGCKTLRKL